MTVFDPTTLHELVDGDDGRTFAFGLVATYRRMLDARVARVVAAIGASEPDPEETMDAVLSLKVSSTMTGAYELGRLAAQVEIDLRCGDLPAARARAHTFPVAAARTGEVIDAYLAEATGTAPTTGSQARSSDSMR